MFDKENLIASSHNSLKEIKTENLSQPECPIIHALHAGGGEKTSQQFTWEKTKKHVKLKI